MIKRFRHWLALMLSNFEPSPAAGAVVPDSFGIADGVDYSLPMVIPDWVSEEQKEKIIQAAVREASSPYHFQFDRPYTYSENLSQFPTADPLREWDYPTRRGVLSRSHLAYERNPLANTAVSLTTMFSVGEGLTVTPYAAEVQELLDAFRTDKENNVEGYEKSFLNDLQVDGELFVHFNQSEDGRTVIVPLRPWEIEWIETERGFHRRIVSYHHVAEQSTGKPGDYERIVRDIPAGEILHVAINQHSYETRGRPELFRILPWLKAYKDWLEGRARQNHWRGALLWWVKLMGGTPGQVTAKRNQYKQPPPPGSLVVTNEKEEWQALDSKVGAADVAEDGRQIKLMVAAGVKLPEYVLSDGANANLASATAQQLPALRKFTDFQDIAVSQVWIPIYKRVIQNAIDAGVLAEMVNETDTDGDPLYEEPEETEAEIAPEMEPSLAAPSVRVNGNGAFGANGAPPIPILPPVQKTKQIKAVDAFDVTGPEIESSDPANLAGALQIAEMNEWASKETASTRMGFNYVSEVKKIKRQEEEKVKDIMTGKRRPPPVPPQFDDEGQPPTGEEKQTAAGANLV